ELSSFATDFLDPPTQICSIFGLAKFFRPFENGGSVDPAFFEPDFLRTGNLDALPFLDSTHERRRILKAVVRSGIKPGITPAQLVDCQIATLKIDIVDGCNLQFATRGGLERSGNIDDIIVVKIQPRNRPGGFRLDGLFLDGDCLAGRLIELDHAIALGIINPVREY